METYELKISAKDWVYICLVGTLFGFFISLFFYFLNEELAYPSTVAFGTFSAFSITLFSFFFITVSNNRILPLVDKRFWYLISFAFSFLSGALGFLWAFFVFSATGTRLGDFIAPYAFYLSLTAGALTFLMGLILHQFISMKYKNESIRNEILDSRIKALENELNPHFLFNALNSMSELVYIDSQKAEQSILDLSKFLRNAIKTESLTDIKNELDMVKSYVDIENIRFGDRIKLHISDKSGGRFKIPKFSIQLLVENAIKHGYENKELNIRISLDNKNIIVLNDGKKLKEPRFGTGLTNLSNRLRLLKAGKLVYENGEETRFKIEVE